MTEKRILSILFAFILILSFPNNGYSEKQTAEKKIKPDISFEVTADLPEENKEFNDEFSDNGLGEIDYEDDEDEIPDPFEPFNRVMWTFNENLYDKALHPIAKGYSKVVPGPIRVIIKNFFSNLTAPITLVSSALQNNKKKVDNTIGRFLINSTLGIGGLLDPASILFKMEKVNEDIDQALAYHDVPMGPYIMLPIFGPSTLRGVFARIPQFFLAPEYILGIGFVPAATVRTEEIVNDISFNLDSKKELDDFALDSYTSVKDFYLQRRNLLIKE